MFSNTSNILSTSKTEKKYEKRRKSFNNSSLIQLTVLINEIINEIQFFAIWDHCGQWLRREDDNCSHAITKL